MSHVFDLIDAAPLSTFIGGAGVVVAVLFIIDRVLAERWAKGN